MKSSAPLLIVDFGLGNLGSVVNMIRKVGGEAKITSSPDEIRQGVKLVLPGVGSFDEGVNSLRERSLDLALKTAIHENGAFLLGICLGMQLLFESSEEGNQPGLSLIQGNVRRFQLDNTNLRVPHMGWNLVKTNRNSHLFTFDDQHRFYFAHSYYPSCENAENIIAETHYGYNFPSVVERERVIGVQFHPEKSHSFGMALFQRYLDLKPC